MEPVQGHSVSNQTLTEEHNQHPNHEHILLSKPHNVQTIIKSWSNLLVSKHIWKPPGFWPLCVNLTWRSKYQKCSQCWEVDFDNSLFRFSDSLCFLRITRNLSNCWRSWSIFSWVWRIASGPSRMMPCVSNWLRRLATILSNWRISRSSPFTRGEFSMASPLVDVVGIVAVCSSFLEFLDEVFNKWVCWRYSWLFFHIW